MLFGSFQMSCSSLTKSLCLQFFSVFQDHVKCPVMWLRYPIVTKNWSNHKSSESVIIVNYAVIVYWVNQWTSDRIRVNMKEDRIISSKWLRLGTLGLLYFVQGAPYGFQASSLPGVATNSIPSSFFVVMDLKFRHEVKDHWSWWKSTSF